MGETDRHMTMIEHPPATDLALFAAGTLAPARREAVVEHIADCEDCYDAVLGALDAIQEPDPRPTPLPVPDPLPLIPAPQPRKAVRWYVTAGPLAAAAALALVAWLQPQWWQSIWGPAAEDHIAAMVAAVGDRRLIEPRLTGGFRHGPMYSPTRGPSHTQILDPQLLDAIAQADAAAEHAPTPELLHAQGVGQLLIGAVDRAIATLENAATRAPSNAAIHSDLAAAYITRAFSTSLPHHWTQGLRAAERAINLNPNLAESRFNRALALEGLGHREAALDAWTQLMPDLTREWKAEARRYLERLQR